MCPLRRAPLDGPLPPLDELRRHARLVVDPALLDLEAGVLQEQMVVGRVLAEEARRERVVGIHREGQVQEAEAGPRGDGTAAREPLRRLVHERGDSLLGSGQCLEHDDVPECLAPVALIAAVDDGRGARDRLAAVERPERRISRSFANGPSPARMRR